MKSRPVLAVGLRDEGHARQPLEVCVAGQERGAARTRSCEDDRIGGGQLVSAASSCCGKCNLGFERDNPSDLGEGDHLIRLS